MKKVIQPEGIAPPQGPYSAAVLASGTFLFLAGQVPFDPKANQLVPDDSPFEQHAIQTLENVKALVEGAGATMADVVRVGIFLRDMGDFPTLNEVYQRYFSEPYPVRTTVQSNLPSFSVEIDAIVVMPE